MNPYRTLWPQMMTLPLAAFARNVIVSAAIVLTALAGADNAHAATYCSTTSSNPIWATFNQISIPPDAAVGATLAATTTTLQISCPANSNFNNTSYGYYLLYSIASTYKLSTSVPTAWEIPSPTKGIGVRFTNITHSNMVLAGAPCTVAGNTTCLFVPSGLTVTPDATSFQITFLVELVKTGNITMGTLAGGPLLTFRSYDILGGVNALSNSLTNLSFGANSMLPSTCTVTTPNIAVTLPTLNVSDLSPPSKTGGNTNFQIDLSCGGGKTVYVTLTDATNPGNTTNQLTLASGSTAGGVKLQILRSGNTLVNFGPDTAISGNPGQWLVGSSGASGTSGNNLSIPLTVQYVSTGPVTPGTVNAVATFTLYYQ